MSGKFEFRAMTTKADVVAEISRYHRLEIEQPDKNYSLVLERLYNQLYAMISNEKKKKRTGPPPASP